jgi:hypothetical protein
MGPICAMCACSRITSTMAMGDFSVVVVFHPVEEWVPSVQCVLVPESPRPRQWGILAWLWCSTPLGNRPDRGMGTHGICKQHSRNLPTGWYRTLCGNFGCHHHHHYSHSNWTSNHHITIMIVSHFHYHCNSHHHHKHHSTTPPL